MADLLIADDHPIFLSGLKAFLEAHGHRVVATAGSADETIRLLRTFRPDVVLVDFHMGGGGGMRVLESMRQSDIDCPVVFLTVGIDSEDILEALGLGINGLVLKNNEPQLLLTCIDAVLRKEDWFEPAMIDLLIARRQKPDLPQPSGESSGTLSSREMEIALQVASGARNREIADRFSITEGTVKVHLHRIFRKLGISSRGELMLIILGRNSA